jgi:hypothetical protein
MENPERIWRTPKCNIGCKQHYYEANPDICNHCRIPPTEYIRADLAAPLPRPSDEP